MKKTFFLTILLLFTTILSYSQDDLLDALDSDTPVNKIMGSTFKSYKLINFETTKLVPKKHLNFIISHRFGSIKNGVDDLFGLDNASTRIAFIYGLTKNINISFSRSKFQKAYDFGTKYKLVSQKANGSPVSIAGYHLAIINTELDKDILPGLSFTNRLRFANQFIFAKKIGKKISLEAVPTILYDGLTTFKSEDNLRFAMGIGGKIQVTKRFGIISDYGYLFNRDSRSGTKNPFSVGVEIETGGHVFQLHFSNAQAMFENGFLVNAQGDWSDGNFFFGFNLSRNFILGSKKKKLK